MASEHPTDPRTRDAAESEEREASERGAAERGAAERQAGAGRGEPDDPREEEGWSQPESSAQKNAPPDLG